MLCHRVSRVECSNCLYDGTSQECGQSGHRGQATYRRHSAALFRTSTTLDGSFIRSLIILITHTKPRDQHFSHINVERQSAFMWHHQRWKHNFMLDYAGWSHGAVY